MPERDISRWTDNPFRPLNPTPEQQEWYDKMDEALRRFREEGDRSMAVEIGLFPEKPRSEREKESAESDQTNSE